MIDVCVHFLVNPLVALSPWAIVIKRLLVTWPLKLIRLRFGLDCKACTAVVCGLACKPHCARACRRSPGSLSNIYQITSRIERLIVRENL
jgi:hypothetical protein